MKNVLYIISGIFSLYLAYITGTGEILNYINFADPLNEMGFCIACLMMGIGLLYCGFTKDEIKVGCSKELDNEWYNESI
jgi:hypothetical protein